MLKQMATRKTAAAILLCLLFTSPVQAQTTKMTSQDLMNLYVGPTDETMTALDKAHRSEREMGDWAFETVAEALQFEPGKVNAKLAAIKPYFSDTGYKAYLAFLTSQPFAPALSSQTLKLATIVNNAPLLIGQGASGGRYAWAFELPVVMTPADQKSVGPITLRVQIGRNAKAPEPQGVIIENWQVFQENVQNPMPNPNTP